MNFYFSQALEFKWTDEDGEEQVGVPYFSDLVKEGMDLGLGVARSLNSED
jgi:hypothetical protein